ncbi:dihydrodipicolinate synthase family protein [Bradyrhizobium sp. CCBAU 53340]|uniref:dihydrodipicolinate synthase family protein n=1 Tax=Bradyrhizobium sp. CCBAU 53340 TaxID=1325112 RepID=UPI002112CFFF|nr:dihydrodipicolinate synthase family protein [Bradyrhizobium sp. CCBAU 53340]
MQTFSDRLRGVHAATIVPMTADFEVDEAQLAAHLASVASTPGINGLLVNGHAGENFVLSLAEKRRVVELARRHAPKDCLIVSGVTMDRAWRPRARRLRWSRPARTGCWYFLPTAGRSAMPMTA